MREHSKGKETYQIGRAEWSERSQHQRATGCKTTTRAPATAADVFTALTEARPYRRGMQPRKALEVVLQMSRDSALDPGVVRLLASGLDEVDASRNAAQASASFDYTKTLAPHM